MSQTFTEILNLKKTGRPLETSSPVHHAVCVQELEDGLAVHVWRNVHPCDVQDGGRQVYVQHDVGVAMETAEGFAIWHYGQKPDKQHMNTDG